MQYQTVDYETSFANEVNALRTTKTLTISVWSAEYVFRSSRKILCRIWNAASSFAGNYSYLLIPEMYVQDLEKEIRGAVAV